MNHYVHIIDQNPLQRLAPFMFVGRFTALFLHFMLNKITDSFYLCGTGGFAYDKEICGSFRYFPEVETDDMLSLFILDGFDNRFEDLRIARKPGDLAFFTAL